MKVVKDFTRCVETESGKFIWNDDDPTEGVNVPVWKQVDYNVDCADDVECDALCKNSYKAAYINGKKGKKCYAYKVSINLNK